MGRHRRSTGITAAVAFELGRRYGLTLHLIGTKPTPSPDAPWRRMSAEELKRFKAEIVGKAVAAGRSPEDDWDQVKHDIEIHENLSLRPGGRENRLPRVRRLGLDRASATVGRDPCVRRADHGNSACAGFGRPDRFEAKKPARVDRTIAGKVEGALALMQLTRQDPLRWFVAFGSLSGRWGGKGLSDYAAANDMLAKLTGWFRHQRPDCAGPVATGKRGIGSAWQRSRMTLRSSRAN